MRAAMAPSLFSCASRGCFCHFALFEEPLLSLRSYAVDFVIAFVAASLGYRLVRARQMAVQYGWLFRRRGPLGWRPTPPAR